MSMSDEQIAQVFGSLGRIEQKIDGHVDTVASHVAQDEKFQKYIFEAVQALQISHAKQKGAARVWTLVGTGVGSIVGTAFAYLLKRHV